jgi:selenide,water dikinase
MTQLGANACTDMTGFGLLGHAFEMAKASKVTINIDSKAVPLLPDVLDLIAQGMLTRGDNNNRVYVGDTVSLSSSVSSEMQSALFDPQTAGGLLISLPAGSVSAFLEQVTDAWVIGNVSAKGEYLIEVS